MQYARTTRTSAETARFAEFILRLEAVQSAELALREISRTSPPTPEDTAALEATLPRPFPEVPRTNGPEAEVYPLLVRRTHPTRSGRTQGGVR
jgi:hypothetical protein